MSKRLSAFILCIIIAVSVAVVFVQGNRKEGYHCDEIFTFGLSNYEGGFVYEMHEEDGTTPKWNTKDDLYEYLAVSDDTRFDYESVIKNQKADVHPPLYYILFHTASSFFPNTYSKYIGIAVNIPFMIGTCILLYLIGNIFFKRRTLSLLTVAVYALSPNCINMAIYLRMYTMLVFFCTALLYLHLRVFENKYKTKMRDCILIGLCVLFGALTHYYFFIFAASIFIYTIIATIKNAEAEKRVAFLARYILPFAIAALIYVIIWPTVFTHMFGTHRGNQAFENVIAGSFLTNIAANLRVVYLSMGMLVCLLFIAAIAVAGRIGIRKKYLLMLTVVGSVYFLIITKIAPYQVDRYIAPVFPMIALCGMYFMYIAINRVCPSGIKKRSIISIFIMVLSLMLAADIVFIFVPRSASDKEYNYLYLKSDEYDRFLTENNGKKCVMVYKDW